MTNENITENDKFYYNIPVEITLKDCHEANKFAITKVKFVQFYLCKQILEIIIIVFLFCLLGSLTLFCICAIIFNLPFEYITYIQVLSSIPKYTIIICILISITYFIFIPLITFFVSGYNILNHMISQNISLRKGQINYLKNNNLKLKIIITKDYIKENFFLWQNIIDIYLSHNLLILLLRPEKSFFPDIFLEKIKYIIIPKKFFNSQDTLESFYNKVFEYVNNKK